MAANAPMIIKRSMVDGRPGEGVLPSGQVAGLIDDLPTCEELVARVVGEAPPRASPAWADGGSRRTPRRDSQGEQRQCPSRSQVQNGIGEIVFAHPPVNAFDSSMWLELPGVVYALARRQEVRCLLIRAEGRGFCAGVDIKEVQANPHAIVQLNRGNFLSYQGRASLRRCR